MSSQRVGDMTVEELEQVIERVIARHLRPAQTEGDGESTPSVSEILERMRRNMIRPAPGEPTARELIAEDRDQWNAM